MNQVVHVEQASNQSPQALFARLADTAGYVRWAPFTKAELVEPGEDDREGVGAVRVLSTRYSRSRERIVAYDPPHHHAYTLLSGLPLRNYRADVRIAATATGSMITWHSEFTAKVPGTGWFYRAILRRFIADLARRLATATEPALACS